MIRREGHPRERIEVYRLLVEAYRAGVFPWSSRPVVTWWSPDPRMVLFCAEFRVSRSLRKTIARFARTPGCEIRIDSAFAQVIEACATTPRDGQGGVGMVPGHHDDPDAGLPALGDGGSHFGARRVFEGHQPGKRQVPRRRGKRFT